MSGTEAARVSRSGNDLRPGRVWAPTVRLLGAATLLLAVTGIATASAAQASQPVASAASTWKVEQTPNPAKAEINALSAVSCTSARACTAVGTYADTLSSPIHALAERWNGSKWRIQPTAKVKGAASTQLFAVSCAAANACTAVGGAFVKGREVFLAEAWNGTTWRVQAVPTPSGLVDGDLYGVSCTSARACTAVGFYSTAAHVRAAAERWNGTAWHSQSIPWPASNTWFFGVSCSAARGCTAVGYEHDSKPDAQPFAEAWNGTKWRVKVVPLPHGAPGGALNAVSCTSPSACTATGTNFGTSPTLAERWNGSQWRIQPTPDPAGYTTSAGSVTLDGVSCTSARACTASGQYSPGGFAAYFLEAWNGSTWRLVSAPVPAHFAHGALLGMSCTATRCTAVGAWSGGPVGQATLAMAN